MDVAILTVGDELLAGDTTNTNASWLGSELSDRGVTVTRMLTVPDEQTAIADATRRYSEAYDAVIVTGGLGGTPDDITMRSVAAAFDRPVEENALARAELERTLAAIADEYPDLDVDVGAEASIPEGARPLLNDAGLSPGCVIENVYVLPGIPDEMKAMFEQVRGEFAGDVTARDFFTPEPEANLIDTLSAARDEYNVVVGCYPDREVGLNRLKVSGDDPEAVDAAVDWLRARVEVGDSD